MGSMPQNLYWIATIVPALNNMGSNLVPYTPDVLAFQDSMRAMIPYISQFKERLSVPLLLREPLFGVQTSISTKWQEKVSEDCLASTLPQGGLFWGAASYKFIGQ
jgi:hypothetical protein